MPSDPSRLIAALARDQINLDLKTLDLCFLAGLYLRADRASLASFASSGVVYAPIFRGAGPAEDGTIDVERVLANLEAMTDLEEPVQSLAEWLYEYASFAMFIAEPVLRAGAQSDASDVSGRVAALLAPLAPEL